MNFPKEEPATAEVASAKTKAKVPSLELSLNRGLGNAVSDSLNEVLQGTKHHAPDAPQENAAGPETEFELFRALINSTE